ncbi:Rieske (2Fe-2S) protein [Halorussus litoreus]|uniref:Rieske (2Fe-2S) protein n=1 Tax=Halorussus litoreus TaxID=1710536 RepID=UPI000E23B8EB|nr:Rieske (2Fe-2S) protein [Halorussus litoreus]
MSRHVICPSSELESGERRIVEVEGLSIGVFNVDGEYHALNNACPHQLAPLCEGTISGTTESDGVGEVDWVRDGEIVRCPWHNWEFDLTTGESVFNPHEVRAGTFEVDVEAPADAGAPDEACACDAESYGTELAGDEPPVETYDVDVEDEAEFGEEMVVLRV